MKGRKDREQMKRKMIDLLLLLLILTGVVMLAYPYISFLLAGRDQSYVIQQYDDSLRQLTARQIKAERERAKAYNDALSPNALYDPFVSGPSEVDEEYGSLLDPDGTGVMGTIQIPRINVELPIFHGTAAETLKSGAGHMEGSALPIGGAGTHAALTGHTGLHTAKLFTDLTQLTIGDEFYIQVLDQVLAYRVDQILVVEPTDLTRLLPVPGKDYVTLVTCTPYGINSHRLLVRGERTAHTPEEIHERIGDTDTITSTETRMLYAGLAFLLLLLLAPVIFKRIKRRCRRSSDHGH